MSDHDRAGLPGAGRTGVAAVDDVLDQVDGLQDRPLEEHAEVYEQAHQRLRRALDDVDPDGAHGGSSGHGR